MAAGHKRLGKMRGPANLPHAGVSGAVIEPIGALGSPEQPAAPDSVAPDVQAWLALLEPALRLNHKALATKALTNKSVLASGGSFRLSETARSGEAPLFNLRLQSAVSSF